MSQGLKNEGIDWIGFQNFVFCAVDVTWRLRLLFWTFSFVLFLDIATKEFLKLESFCIHLKEGNSYSSGPLGAATLTT
jgi:hypothetical protein